MMQALKKKLKSNGGMSLILALGLVLICTMVASTTLMAAAVGSNRNSNRTAQQRGYLAVSSAASLVMEETEDLGVLVLQAERIVHKCGVCSSDPRYRDYEVFAGGGGTSMAGAFVQLVQQACLTFADPNSDLIARPFEETFAITADDPQGRLPLVDCRFMMYHDYSITMIFSTAGSDHVMTVKIPAQKLEETSKPVISECCVHSVVEEIEYSDGRIEQNVAEIKYDCDQHLKKLTVNWGAPQLKRGEALG